jgi:hypothetical protein
VTYEQWADYHASMFGLQNEGDVRMLAAWCDLFHSAGYEVAELVDATRFIATHDPPKFRTDHLAALQARIRERRNVLAPSNVPDDHPLGNCTLCNSTGRIVVPLIPGMLTVGGKLIPDDGRWRTCAVLCRCNIGRWFADRQAGDKVMLGIDHYSRLSPDWEDVIRRHDAELKKAVEADRQAGVNDKLFGEVLGRLNGRVKTPQAAPEVPPSDSESLPPW